MTNETKNFNVRSMKKRPNYPGKTFTMASQTIPNQSLSMTELLQRYAKGQDLGPIGKEPIYEEEDTNGINPRTLDLVDIQNMKEFNKKRIVDLENEVEIENRTKAEKQAAEAAKKAAKDKEIEDLLNSKKKPEGH